MGYTMAEKILMKNTGLSHLAPGDLIMTRPDMCMVHDIYTPFVVQKLDEMKFRRLADPFIDSAVHCSIDRDLLCANLQPRCEVLEDIPPQLDFFDAVLPIDAEMYRNKKQKTTPESAKEALTALLPVLEAQTDWTRDAIFEACKTLAESMEKKNGWLLFPLGIALSGKSRTPGGGTDLAAMMGKEETVKRVKSALEKL